MNQSLRSGLPQQLWGNFGEPNSLNQSSFQNNSTISEKQVPAASIPDLISSRMGRQDSLNFSATSSIDSMKILPQNIHEPTLPSVIHHPQRGNPPSQEDNDNYES